MALDKASTARLYRRRAPRYDLTAHLYYLVGLRGFAIKLERDLLLDVFQMIVATPAP
ncbi:MAG: hypothetical protein M1376_00360 [Planctomycetes bacterium]|nr:hypothetical protein [Planctomycetota bacterium]